MKLAAAQRVPLSIAMGVPYPPDDLRSMMRAMLILDAAEAEGWERAREVEGRVRNGGGTAESLTAEMLVELLRRG